MAVEKREGQEEEIDAEDEPMMNSSADEYGNDEKMNERGDDDEKSSDDENDETETSSTTITPFNTISKSWSVASSHVPTFTGGKVTHCKSHTSLLMPVHGDLAVVDSQKGVKVGTVRGEDAVAGDDDDEDEGVDQDAITSYAIDHNDHIIMTCARNNILRQYSFQRNDNDEDGSIRIQLTKTWGRVGHTLPVTSMEFHSSNVFLATGSVDGTVRIWDVRGAYVTHVFRPVAGGDGGGSGRLSVTSLQWRNEIGQLVLAIARDDGSMTIHDLRNDENLIVLRDHVSAVTCMDWWGEEFFVSTGRDAILNLWRIIPIVEQEDRKKQKKKKHSTNVKPPKLHYRRIQSVPVYEQVEGMVISPSEKSNDLRIVTAGSKGFVRLWKATVVPGHTPELKQSMAQPESQAFGDTRGGYMGLVLNHVAVAQHNKKEQVIAVDAEHNLSFLSSKLETSRTIVGHNDEILDLKVIPERDSIVVATNSPQIRIFQLGNFSCKVLDGHTATVLCVEVSPCGRFVASCGKDKIMRLWNVDTLRCVATATGHTEPIGACGLSRKVGRYEVGGKAAKNGGGAFCITASVDRTLKRWNLPGIQELTNTEGPVELLAATSVRGHERDINIVSVAPNDSLVASGSQDKTVKLWNPIDLSLKATLKGHRRGVWDCQFSPIDRVLATSSGDKTIKLWSLADFSCVRTFQGHQASVLRVRFLKTGLQLVSAGGDGLIKLWTIRTNECESTLDGHTNKIWALDMSPDGRTVVSGGADSKLAVWEDNTQIVEDERRAKEAETILLDQKLANHMRHREYGKALEIALQVDKPMQVLKVITAIIENDLKQKKGSGLEGLQAHAKRWDMERVAQVLKYCRDWNTRARNSTVAMIVVKAVVTSIPVEQLSSANGIPELLAGITPYAERHFDRLDRLHTSTYLLDFTLSCMGSLDPAEASSEKDFERWEASSKLVLPPKFVDGRIQIGGKTMIGKNKVSDESSRSSEEDDVVSIGDSSASSDSSSTNEDEEMEDADEQRKTNDKEAEGKSSSGDTSNSDDDEESSSAES